MDNQKSYFDELNAKLDRVIDAMVTKGEFEEFRSEVLSDTADLKETINHLATSMDKLLKVLTDLQVEYAAIKMQMTRYDRWFKELAEKVGLELKS
jgi:CRISPR/Cas system CMR-associated protein Cmr5 small subunit